MKRRSLFRTFLGSILLSPAAAKTSLKTYYITGLYYLKDNNYCSFTVPLQVQARNREEALRALHITVWSEAEFLKTQGGQYCIEIPKERK